MKPHLLLSLLIFLLLSACTEPSGADAVKLKRKEIAAHKQSISALQEKIIVLEREIASISPDSAVQREIAKAVDIEVIKTSDFNHFIDLRGAVISEQSLRVDAGMPGMLKRVLVQKGQRVNKGQLIAEVEAASMEESLKQLQINADLAKTAYERQENLWNQKIGSEFQYLQAKTAYESVQQQIVSVQEQLKLSKVYAPVSGVVDDVYLKVGQNILPGMPLATLINLGDLRASALVPDNYMGLLRPGMEVTVKLPDIGETLNTRISNISAAINPMTRSFNVECKLPSKPNIKPNMYATLSIRSASFKDAIVVSENVVQQDEKGSFLLVIDDTEGNMRAQKRYVEKGLSYGGKTQILKGLKAGEQYISFGYQTVADGQLISAQ